jgi:hypothetical protein
VHGQRRQQQQHYQHEDLDGAATVKYWGATTGHEALSPQVSAAIYRCRGVPAMAWRARAAAAGAARAVGREVARARCAARESIYFEENGFFGGNVGTDLQ